MLHRIWPPVSALLLASCAAPPPPPPPAPIALVKPRPVVRAAPSDWFQEQLQAARAARASHLPKSDVAGAQLAYDRAVRNACTRVALSGPDKYRARCEPLLRPTAAAPDVFACQNENTTDQAELIACND